MVDNNGGRPNTGIRRVTKKVKRRPESSQEADDPTVDGDGQQIQNQDTTRISYKATLMGDVHEAVQHIRMEEGFELQDGDVKRVEEEAFGPWMLVERHHWGKARSNGEPRNSGQRANQGGSRFSILEKEDGLNQDVFSGQVEDM
ncbi:hypothetical protein Golob_027570 [Gossypium lobatum]|uniref:Uncharacterized protein n=1 Tax=Gossypium lobatum TaxID=34289 RepID=A0A7J8NIN3_9ROSI|nr:hypothetical protein [Gossypium lobatum]